MRIQPNSELAGVTGKPIRSAPPEPRLGSDQLALSETTALQAALAQTPAVRPQKVAEAKGKLADPSYPPEVLIQKIASLLAIHLDSPQASISPDPTTNDDR